MESVTWILLALVGPALVLTGFNFVLLWRRVAKMAGELERIESELRELTDAGDGMRLLLETLATEIRAGANSPARMNAIADTMDAKGNAWRQAIIENTPAAEPPPDAPVGETE